MPEMLVEVTAISVDGFDQIMETPLDVWDEIYYFSISRLIKISWFN